ncbi:MAG: hypothetical protein V4820_11765 [Pseudomonadota bacterium]
MSRDIKTSVVLHIGKDSEYSLRVWDPNGEVLVLWIDESAGCDRVYEQTAREEDIADLKALIGDSRIGNAGDGTLDDQTVQAIRATHFRLTGGKLAPVENDGGAA